MKSRNSFLMRCLAVALALVLLVSNANLGVALQAFAVESVSTTAAAVVANNYALTDAEKALLNSGLLAGGTISYTAPTNDDNLITVDTENHKITAATYVDSNGNTWHPTSAVIKVGGDVAETLNLNLANGEATYTYAENAFSVVANYEAVTGINIDVQNNLLNTAAWLKQGVANLDAVSAQSGNLYILEQAMPELVKLATNGVQVTVGGGTSSVSFSEECKAAVNALNAQMSANGKLKLSIYASEYDANFKTQYLMVMGSEVKAEVSSFVKNIGVINEALTTMVDNLALFIQNGWVDETTASQLKTLAGCAANLEAGLEAVNADPWTAANNTALLADSVNYSELDGYVANLGETTAVEITNPLRLASTELQANMSMFNVKVVVEMQIVNGDDTVELKSLGKFDDTITVAAGATADDVLDEIGAKSSVEDRYLTEICSAYDLAHFDRVVSELPETLEEDTTYTITYTPKTYTVTYGYETDAPTSVPYGYRLTLPVNADVNKAYDYAVNGETKAQGEIITIEGDTTVSRSVGDAYTTKDLYQIIAENYTEADSMAYAILTSGALDGDETVRYRQPDAGDAESLVKLENGTLTAQAEFNSYYPVGNALNWVPYSYGETTGAESLFAGNTAAWSGDSAKAIYRLTLTNHSVEKVAGILATAETLKAEADAQISVLDRLNAKYDTMGQLDKTKLGALNGVIDVTDFTPGDGTDTDEKNLEVRANFKKMVSGIIANNLDANNYLKIYIMLTSYRNNGLSWYYENSAAVINEINALSGYLAGMTDEENLGYLQIMVTAAGYAEYAEKITDLNTLLAEVKRDLTAPNAAINMSSGKVGALVNALTADGKVSYTTPGNPYLTSVELPVADASNRTVTVIVAIGDEQKGSDFITLVRGTELTQEHINELKAKLSVVKTNALGANANYYNESASASLDALVGTTLDTNTSVTFTYSEKDYTVVIDGEADQIINLSNLTVKLPEHTTEGWKYTYSVDGEDKSAGEYTFTKTQLDSLFANGSYTITRTETNEAAEKLEGSFGDWLVKDADGNVIAMVANVAGDKDGIMGFVKTIANAGYTYIALNDEPLLYLNVEDTLEVKLQTLINAILNDNTFGSQTLIDLGNNGQGKMVTADISVGNSADDLDYTALDFTLNLTSVPAQMGTVATGLETVKNYMTFQSQDGIMTVKLNLPEKVYEAYLTALLATGNVDKTDMNAVNNEIAFMFLYDYIDLIINTDATTTTYTNTLDKLGYKKDLTGYEGYYQMLKSALTNDGVVINSIEDDGEFDVNVAAGGKTAIDKLLGLVGIDATSEEFSTYVNMIYEYKTGDELTATAVATLGNLPTTYEALVLDINATGESTLKTYANKFDYTPDLPGRVASIAGDSVVILLDNVDGSLNFGSGRTVLDLNGYTVNGSVSSAGTLYIVDSRMETATNGSVTGGVQATAILGGKYGADVSSMLKEGYKQVDGVVQNALYTIESDGYNITFVINTDVMDDTSVTGYLPNAQALAVDIAVDLALNFFTAASLTADGNTIYAVNFDNLIALLGSSNKVDDVITKAVGSISADGITAFANTVLADLLDFGAVASALNGDQDVASYELATSPWYVEVSHETSEDYIDIAITSSSDEALAKGYNVSLKMVGDNKQIIADLCEELSNVVNEATVEVELDQPTYNGSSNTLSVVGRATANVDVDLTKNADYITVITVIMANGNPGANADAMVAGLNNNDLVAVKTAFDEMTVEDVFTALKKLNRNDDFATLASNAGVTIDVASAAELESIYRLVLCAAGKALDVLEITGRDSKLGGLDPDGDGVYEYTGKISRSGDVSAKGYTADFTVEYVEVTLKVALFGETNCLWGDANHDEIVNSDDASLIEEYVVKDGQLDVFFCTIRTDVNDDGVINTDDASLIREYCVGNISVFPAENK